MRRGDRNSITDVAGIRVGNAHDAVVRSGVTVVLPDRRCVAAVDVRGGGTGSREIELLGPDAMVERIDALVMSGGSAFGLGAADAVQARLRALGRGHPVGAITVPIVPQVILFDLANGGDKAWGDEPPYRRLAANAFDAADVNVALGSVGAGHGAVAGDVKGGLGTASAVIEDLGVTVGALAAVNSVGAVTYAGHPRFFAWDLELGDEFGGLGPPPAGASGAPRLAKLSGVGENTTLVTVATDATLDRAAARRIAIMAQDGLAHAIRPAHTPLDGDTVFVLATGTTDVATDPVTIARVGAVAGTVVARAIARGVWEAEAAGTVPTFRETLRR